MSEFISGLSIYEKFYFYVALAGTVFFLLQSVFTFLDLGDTFDSDMDLDGDVDTDLSFLGLSLPFNLFTMRGIIGFMMIFGWAGLSFARSGMNPYLTFVFALIAGFIMMLIISLIYYAAFKLRDSGNVDITSAIGKKCEVYLTIPGENKGIGKVHIVLNGSLKEYDAISLSETINSGEFVEVTEVMNDKLVVKKVDSKE